MEVNKIIETIRKKISTGEGELTDRQVKDTIHEHLLSDKDTEHYTCSELSRLSLRIFYAIRKDLDILDPLAEDPLISEIMVNGKDHIFVERAGRLERVNAAFETTDGLEEVIRRIAAKVQREINELNPIVDARLPDGSRVNAVYKNIALNGPILTIRKFPETGFTMEDLIEIGTLTRECADYLKILVESGYNCFVSGGTSTGKTTFLNVLSNYIPEEERVIVIEDSAELQIRNIANVVRMECKNSNSEGRGLVKMEDLIKTSLRMRPDRIIVGEVRGKEVLDMIQAMNTGHDGSLSTGHGNSIEGMLRRLESMFLQAADFPIEAIRGQIAEGIDIMIHLGKLPDKSRKVLEVSEVIGLRNGTIETRSLFRYRAGEGLERTEHTLFHREKLELRRWKDASAI